ncbi:hypothetical protein [Symbiopectobacterium sp. RP]|uniref:hypothetical protein n=1 Tax=Symbiopectobacterium sp. RP TaxID=3248553 RepID=UPI003D286ACB
MILRCEDPSFRWAASIKSIYSTKPLQAAVAGLGVAIGPWQLLRDDIASGVLAAPLGFVEEGSCYCLLSPSPLFPDTFHTDLLA